MGAAPAGLEGRNWGCWRQCAWRLRVQCGNCGCIGAVLMPSHGLPANLAVRTNSPKATACCVTAVTVAESSEAATCCRRRPAAAAGHRWAGSSAVRLLIAAVLLQQLLLAVARLIAAAKRWLGCEV